MADISKIILPGDETEYNFKDRTKDGVFVIIGTGTTAGTWLGTDDRITEYYDGLAILYKIPIAGASTTTLNINDLGAKTVYIYNSSKLTTHFSVGSVVLLVYSSTLNSGCFVHSNYWSDTNYNLRDYYYRPKLAQALYRYKYCAEGLDGLLVPLTITNQSNSTIVQKTQTALSFHPNTLWYYSSTTTISAGSVIGAQTLYRANANTSPIYTFNENLPTYSAAYLVGDYDAATDGFTLDQTDTTSWYKILSIGTAPSVDAGFIEGKWYLLVGYTYSTANYLSIFVWRKPLYFDGTNLCDPLALKQDKLGDAGSSIQPVYFSDGVPTPTTYTLNASVPSGAKFTDTTYTAGSNVTISGTTISAVDTTYDPATTSTNGLLTAADKTKLNTLQNGSSYCTVTSYTDLEVRVANLEGGIDPPTIAAMTTAQIDAIIAGT